VELESINFDLRECVEDAMQIFAESAHQKGIELSCQVPEDVPRALRGDPGRRRQILANLVGHVIKFTERGDVFVGVTALDYGLLRFEIRDTGLGLAISKQLVEMMGGEIAVVSTPGWTII